MTKTTHKCLLLSHHVHCGLHFVSVIRGYQSKYNWAQDYKEKHKLDSKLISDSTFDAHLSFCKNRETINLFSLKLKTHTPNSGDWSSYAGGEKHNQNMDTIKCGKTKSGKVDGTIQCYMHKLFHQMTRPRVCGSYFGVSSKIPRHLTTVNGSRVRCKWRLFH